MNSAIGNQGLYILAVKLTKSLIIHAGKLPEAELRPGIYLYVGRARRHLSSRIQRHLHQEKKRFWHIDYLLQRARIERVWIKPDSLAECQTVSRIKKLCAQAQTPIRGFGASDCRCDSHLIHMPYDSNHVCAIIKKLHFKEVTFDGNFT